MENEDIMKYVDHTILGATTTWNDVRKVCEEAYEYQTASVCIPPSFVKKAKENYSNINICTVIGFPLGYNTTESKVFETKNALRDGANEIDMVINLGFVKSGKFNEVLEEIVEIKKVVGDKILKVIIETCYLTDEEIVKLSKCVTSAKADYIKTSTGFGSSGANQKDIKLISESLGRYVKIKASGGIKTKQDMIDYINLGVSRLGTSSSIKILYK